MVIFIGWKHITQNLSETQFCMKNIHETIIMYFSSIGHHIISYVAKFEVKIPLVRVEIKKRNLSWVDWTN